MLRHVAALLGLASQLDRGFSSPRTRAPWAWPGSGDCERIPARRRGQRDDSDEPAPARHKAPCPLSEVGQTGPDPPYSSTGLPRVSAIWRIDLDLTVDILHLGDGRSDLPQCKQRPLRLRRYSAPLFRHQPLQSRHPNLPWVEATVAVRRRRRAGHSVACTTFSRSVARNLHADQCKFPCTRGIGYRDGGVAPISALPVDALVGFARGLPCNEP
jgi:hypothetical protein